MMLSLHTQVEDLANMLHLRRSENARRASRHQAHLDLLAAILEVPVGNFGQLAPASLAARPQPALARIGGRHARAA